MLLTLYNNLTEIWVVEWHTNEEGNIAFNVTTLDEHIKHSYTHMQKKTAPAYHLLSLADSIDQAHEQADMWARRLPSAEIIPLTPKN